MKVLLDQGTPAPLRHFLGDHAVHTAYEMGWDRLTNGEFLDAAEDARFEALITTDQSLRFQQNLAARRILVLVLPTTDWAEIRQHVSQVLAALSDSRPGEAHDVSFE
jgi:hypothetical protein